MKHTATLKLAFALACAIGSGAALADAQTLRFGLEAQYPPFESKAPNGDLQGFDIDIGNAVCQTAKLSCKWVETSFDGLIPALKGRKFDAINSAMHVTAKRVEAIDFTTIIYQTPSRLVARSNSGLVPTIQSLKGKQIGVLQGSIHENYARTRWEPFGTRVVPYQDQNQIYADLITGRLDATFAEEITVQKGFLSRAEGRGFGFSGGAIVDDSIMGPGVAFGIRKGDEVLKLRLNEAIKNIKNNGTLDLLAKKYFPAGGVVIK
ncbi:transporter substrate-binding domain-containing protein [Burkholderia cepacia]|uniref:transporter substrate-binding domain-containing protein n=1 Tax=Burkholderia cepacia TaxID=292 RepID=UPI00249D976C|nr:transporter substrate-binding domain-containing protein [Burkholderia cepacia]WGY71344.1 transporter substrate-binding domain-containing protein [Burkholderia cepacia]